MAYTKKTWVNVPDESNLPAIPDGQDSLARFDAENMNRLEDGIEEAINKAGDHTHSANDIESGIVGVEYGGTGKDNISKDNILVGNGTGAMIEKTPTQVRELIDAAPSSHTHPIGSHNHSTDNITSGTLGVSRGGTGKSSITKGNYLIGNDTSEMVEKTPDEVRANIGAAPSNHNQSASTITAGTLGGQVKANASAMTSIGTAQVRDIYAGTSDMTAGSSPLTTGTIYFVYE